MSSVVPLSHSQAADLFDPTNVDWAPSLNLGHEESSRFQSSLRQQNKIVDSQSCSSMSRRGMFEYIAVPDAKRQRVEEVNMPECVDENLMLEEDYEFHEEIHIKDEPLSEEDEDEINLQAYMLSERLLAQQQLDSRTSTPSPNALVMNLPEEASSTTHHVNPDAELVTPGPVLISIPEENDSTTHHVNPDAELVTPGPVLISIPEENDSTTHHVNPGPVLISIPEENDSATHHVNPDAELVTSDSIPISIPEETGSSTHPESWETVTSSPNRLVIPENVLSPPVETVTASPNRLVINIPDKGLQCTESPHANTVAPKPMVINIPDSSPQRTDNPVEIASPKSLKIDIPVASSPKCPENNSAGIVMSPKVVPDETEVHSAENTVTISVDDRVTVICTTPVPPVCPPRPPVGSSVEKAEKTWEFTVGTTTGQTKRCMITTTNDTSLDFLSDDALAQLATAVMGDKAPSVCKVVPNIDGTSRFLIDDCPNKEPIIRPCPISIVKLKSAQKTPEVSVKRLIKTPLDTNKLTSTKPNTMVTLDPSRPSILKSRTTPKISNEVTITSLKKDEIQLFSDRRRKQEIVPKVRIAAISDVPKTSTPGTESQIKIASYSGSQNPQTSNSLSQTKYTYSKSKNPRDNDKYTSDSHSHIKIAPCRGATEKVHEKVKKMGISSLYTKYCASSASFVCQVCEERTVGETATINHVFKHCFVEGENKRFSCTECKFECNAKTDLRVHSTVHDIFKFQCHHCSIYLMSEDQLSKHLHISHTETASPQQAPKDKALEEQSEREQLAKQAVENLNIQSAKKKRRYMFFHNYMCNLCFQPFQSKRHLHVHAESAHSDKVLYAPTKGGKGGNLKCNLCDFTTSSTDHYYTHVFRHRGISAYFCKDCKRSFDSRQGLYKHCQVVHPHDLGIQQRMWVEKEESQAKQEPLNHLDYIEPSPKERNSKQMVIIVCSLCSERFQKITELYRHCLFMHNANKTSDYNEDVSYTNHRTLWRYRFGQFGIKGFMCKYCGKLFGYRHGVLLHQKLVHKKEVEQELIDVKKYTCDICHKTMLNKHWLQNHISLKHLNPVHRFPAFKRRKGKRDPNYVQSKRQPFEVKARLVKTNLEKAADQRLQSITQPSVPSTSAEPTAEKVAVPESENVDKFAMSEPNDVDGKSEQEEFDWAYWTALGVRKSSRKRKKREFSDFIDYEEADVSQRAAIFDITKGRKKWIYVNKPDNEVLDPESPPSSDAPVLEESPQLEEKAPEELTDTTAPITDDSKPAATKRKYVKNTLAKKWRRKRSLVMKKKHYKKKIALGALAQAKGDGVAATLASETTPLNLASDVTPSNLTSEVIPPNSASELIPPNLALEDISSNPTPEVIPSNVVSEVSPSKSPETVENSPIRKIPFKKRLSRMDSSENIQAETEHAGVTENQVEVQRKSDTMEHKEKSPETSTVGDCEISENADNPEINSIVSEMVTNILALEKNDSVSNLVVRPDPQIETSVIESGTYEQENISETSALPNANKNIPMKRKLNVKKTGKGRKKIKAQTSNLQTENAGLIPDPSLRESVIKTTPEKNMTEVLSLEVNKVSTFVPDSTEKEMPILHLEVASQPESPATPGMNESLKSNKNNVLTPVSMRKSARERKKRDFVDFVQITNRRSKLSAGEVSVEQESTQLATEGKEKCKSNTNTSEPVGPLSNILSPAVNSKRSRKPSLKLLGIKEPATPEIIPKPGNKRARKSNVNPANISEAIKIPELDPKIGPHVQKKGRKSNLNTGEGKSKKGKKCEDTKAVVVPCEAKEEKKQLVDASLSVASAVPIPDNLSETTEIQSADMSSIETQERVQCNTEESRLVSKLLESQNGSTINAAESPNSSAVNAAESPNSSAVNAAESPNSSAVNAAESPNSSAVNAAESPNSSAVNAAESPNNLAVNAAESPTNPSVNAAESPNGQVVNTAENSGLVSSVGETVSNLDPKESITAVRSKGAKVRKLSTPELSDSLRKSSRQRKKREIADFEFL